MEKHGQTEKNELLSPYKALWLGMMTEAKMLTNHKTLNNQTSWKRSETIYKHTEVCVSQHYKHLLSQKKPQMIVLKYHILSKVDRCHQSFQF